MMEPIERKMITIFEQETYSTAIYEVLTVCTSCPVPELRIYHFDSPELRTFLKNNKELGEHVASVVGIDRNTAEQMDIRW